MTPARRASATRPPAPRPASRARDARPSGSFALARVHDEPGSARGYRVLVDRLWPRGISKERAALDEWLQDAAPSTGLRVWYGHRPERYEEFARRYRAELRRGAAAAAVTRLLEIGRRRPVLLLTATKDVEHSGARVLLERLRRSARRRA